MFWLIFIAFYILGCESRINMETISNAKDKISEYSRNYSRPFLKHIKYFEGKNNLITVMSIGNQWSNLSREMATPYVKGFITIKAAEIKGKCPYGNGYSKEYIMDSLKHPFDTGIVNRDGSINEAELISFIDEAFEYDSGSGRYVLWEHMMNSFLKKFAERDALKSGHVHWYLPDLKTVAFFEWQDFFLSFSDIVRGDKRGIYVNTLLMFYFESDLLYERALSKH